MNQGLENIVVAETKLSRVEGNVGRLLVRGFPIEDFSVLSYEEAAALLWERETDWGEARAKVYARLRQVLPCTKGLTPLEGVRLCLANLPDQATPGEVAVSLFIGLAAAKQGQHLLEPDPGLPLVRDFCRLYFGKEASLVEWQSLSRYLVTVAEHGMNASTFCARIVASTGASEVQAATAGLGALSGPLHGGAPGPVLDLLDRLRSCADMESEIRQCLSRKERLMGFGHRVYRERDPRASILREAASALCSKATLEHALRVERVAEALLEEYKPERPLRTNVEFYTAVLLDSLGFDRSEFTALFACGRVLGWMAHYREQIESGRLIRPKARYVGPESRSAS